MVASTPRADLHASEKRCGAFYPMGASAARAVKGPAMDHILPPHPQQPTVVHARHGARRGREVLVGGCVAAAMYLAFAVGAPWLLQEAPPDTYAVVATSAACAMPADARPLCAVQPVVAR
jgi:H+/gluconate symporter-like permease